MHCSCDSDMGSMNNEITAGLINTSDAMWPQAVAGTVSIFLIISKWTASDQTPYFLSDFVLITTVLFPFSLVITEIWAWMRFLEHSVDVSLSNSHDMI